MGRPSIIKLLPHEVRKAIDNRLIERNFTDYKGLARELTEQGYPISKTALHRYGRGFERSMQRAREVARLRAAGVDLDIAAAIAQ